MQKLLVVDGSNLLFQMFYGMPSRILNKDGKPIHGTLGFVGALLKILRMTQPTHAVVLFDGEHHNERKDLDAEYKANRPDFSALPEEETPFSQLPDIYAALDYLKIKRAETTTCETDDLVAAYALRYGRDMQVVISSFDSDFFQLITQNVSVLRYRGAHTLLCDEKYVWEKFGVTPKQYADFKALIGDNADNIKGAYKIGPKTAAKLLREYGELRTLLERLESVEKPSVKSSIAEAKERLKRNQKLIKLDGCTELPFHVEQLDYTDTNKKTREVLQGIGL